MFKVWSKSGGGEGPKKEKCSAHSIMPPYFLSPLLPRMHNLKGNVFLYISFFIQPSPTSMVFLIFWKLQRNDVWSLIEVLKLNFCQDFEAAVYQDFEAEVSSRFWGFSLVDILKAEVWSRFWRWFFLTTLDIAKKLLWWQHSTFEPLAMFTWNGKDHEGRDCLVL